MTSSPTTSISIPPGHVGLVLLSDEDSSFYLQVPSNSIASLCLKPRKYLLFLGWCILGVEGVLSLESDGEALDPDGDLGEQEKYHYITEGDAFQAVDLEVIRMRTHLSSQATETRENFRSKLLERDVYCVWTRAGRDFGAGLHIIPYKRGSEWLRLIVENRPHYDENVEDLYEINDIRNGVFANSLIHNGFDSRRLVILKTPNHCLQPNDIPPRRDRNLSNDVIYPSNSRYTLQWINPDESVTEMIQNNRDAAFKKYTRKLKPSDLLLHYNYGAAVVKWWGRGTEVLHNQFEPPRPREPVPTPLGPSRTSHNRNIAIRKRDESRKPGAGEYGAVRVASSAGNGALEASSARFGTDEALAGEDELEEQTMWDEDDVMLFFWGNSQAAKDRHWKKVQESAQRMERWRESLPHVFV